MSKATICDHCGRAKAAMNPKELKYSHQLTGSGIVVTYKVDLEFTGGSPGADFCHECLAKRLRDAIDRDDLG